MPVPHTIAGVFLAAAAVLSAPFALAQDRWGDATSSCGPIARQGTGGYGPFDYRHQRERLEIVERFHFTPQVEALIRGQSTYIGGDLSYLMRTSPNHHRGLVSIMRFAERTGSRQPPHLQYSIDCYFERAIRFAPDDTVVRVLFATYLHSARQTDEAERQLKLATELAGDNPLSHYNIGLAAFEIGLHDMALKQAHQARAMGFERPDLQEKLRAAGRWKEPTD